jgi:ubiquinone/menaquinone biosynthesis C-methylase UbiE
MNHLLKIYALLFLSSACAPYAKGPVFTKERAQQVFQPVVKFMDIQPGMTIADVGAGSGALTVSMATQLDSCIIYIQDIDRKVLEQQNVDKMIAHYSNQFEYDLGGRNQFHLVYGSVTNSNLPNRAFDIIYSNATLHVFDHPEDMLRDLRQKLKPTGKLFVRDGFRRDHGLDQFCSDKKCAKRLYSVDELITMMTHNGFQLIKQTPDSVDYRIFGFEIR